MKTSQKSTNHETWTGYGYDERIVQLHNNAKFGLPKTVKREAMQPLSKRNLELFITYDKKMARDSKAKATRIKHMQTILTLTHMIGKDWKDVLREDIDDCTYKIMEIYSDAKGMETYTSYDMKKILRIFFRWFKTGSRDKDANGTDPYEVQGIKMGRIKDRIAREDLITDEDIEKLLNACGENMRDRAMIHVHSEAGTRPSELLSLRIKDVKIDEYGAVISVIGKTTARPIRLVQSVPNLLAYMQNHPYRNNSDAPLWVMIDPDDYGKPMTNKATRAMFNRRAKKAGFGDRRIYLNLFRHSEATKTATFMGEAEMRKRHGWTATSKMPARYVHLVDSDVEKKVLEHYGIKPKEEKKPNAPVKCQFCDMFNPHDSELCSKCAKPLDLEYAVKLDQEKQEEKKNMQGQIDALNSKMIDLENSKQEVQEGREEDKKTVTKEKKKRTDHEDMLAKVLAEVQKQREDMQNQIDELRKELSKKKN